MKRFLLFFDERSILSPLQLSVLIADNREGSASEMRESYTREHVMLQEKRSSVYILQISHISSIIKITGGVMLGILWNMEERLILKEVFLDNSRNF